MEVFLSMNNNSTSVLISQDARELTPEEKLSPIDMQNLDFVEVVDKVLAVNEIREEIGEEWLEGYRQALLEDARLGHKRFLDIVRRYNRIFPNNPILIPSEADTIAGWLQRPEPEVIWDIEELMGQGTSLIIAGNVGIGKSWETMHLTFQLRLGGTWHGLQCRQLMPIYVGLESTENQMQRRIRKLASIYPDVRDINFVAAKGADYRLNTQSGKENLFALLRGYGQNFGVIILDPLALFIEGKLEKVDWNNEVEPSLTEIKEEFG
jgi:RecA-family ATPase